MTQRTSSHSNRTTCCRPTPGRRSCWTTARAAGCTTPRATPTWTAWPASPSTRWGTRDPDLVAALTEQAGKLWHVSNLYHTAPQARLAAAAVPTAASPTGSSSATRAPRPTRARSSSPASGRMTVPVIWPPAAEARHRRVQQRLSRPHLRRAGRHAPGEVPGGLPPADARRAHRRSSTTWPARQMHRRRRLRGDRRAGAGRGRRPPGHDPEFLHGLRDAVRPAQRPADLRRGAVRAGPHRHAVGPPGLRRDARPADQRQAAGRRPADGRGADDRSGSPTSCIPAITAARSPPRRWSQRWPKVVLDTVTDPTFLAGVAEKGAISWSGWRRSTRRTSRRCAGKGLMIGVDLDVPANDVVQAGYRHGLLLVNAGPNTLRLVPPLIISHGGDRHC